MTGFNHGMTGAVIALIVKNPAVAVPLSFASHYLTDLLPHMGFKQKDVLGRTFNKFLAADFCLAILCMLILAILFPKHIFLVWTCMTLAAIPDLIWWFYHRTVKQWPKGLDRFTLWHYKINAKFHVAHLNYDAAWFGLMWAIAIFIKIK